MQYDDGSGSGQPGGDIVIDAPDGSGSEDVGPATYDSDHDGVADSVILGQGDDTFVITDSDHDGHADSITEYDAQGHQIAGSDGSDGSGGSSGSGASSHDGSDSVTGNYADPADQAHQDTDLDHAGLDPAAGEASWGADADGSTHFEITVTGDDGTHVAIGVPTVDLDQDGRPDTAVVHHPDGSVTGYTDRDGDGQADQITQVGVDGHVVIAVADGAGGWTVQATGHMDSQGALVEDPEPNPGAQSPEAGQ